VRYFLAAFIVIASAPWGARISAQADHSAVGIISSISGEVFLERGKTRTAARLADLLYAEDRIVVAEGQAVALFCPSSEKLTLSRGTTVQFGADRPRVLKGSAPVRMPARCLLPRVALGSESLERMGGLKARGGPPVALYVGGAVSSDRPQFCWGAVKDAELYRLTLKTTKNNQQVWETTTTAICAAYPSAGNPLTPSEYEWEVFAESKATVLARGTAAFEVKPGADLAGSNGAGTDDALLRAIELENRGYYSEAAAYFRTARETNPGDKRLTQHLAWLYWNSGLINAANEEFKRLAAMPEK
jgi:hypothetical protein